MTKLLIVLITACAFIMAGCPKEEQVVPDGSVVEPKEEVTKDEKKEEAKVEKTEAKEEAKVSPPATK